MRRVAVAARGGPRCSRDATAPAPSERTRDPASGGPDGSISDGDPDLRAGVRGRRRVRAVDDRAPRASRDARRTSPTAGPRIPSSRSFAERIAQAQQAELDAMVQWLQQRDLPIGSHDARRVDDAGRHQRDHDGPRRAGAPAPRSTRSSSRR